MAKFRFNHHPEQHRTTVFYQGKKIGELKTAHEPGGRFCFLLSCDPGPKRRQFRGRVRAAEALLSIHKIVQEYRKKRLSLEELIVRAWVTRPRGADSRGKPVAKKKAKRSAR